MSASDPKSTQMAEVDALRARQRSRNRALGLTLVALAALFFAITVVKIGIHAKQLQDAKHPVAPLKAG